MKKSAGLKATVISLLLISLVTACNPSSGTPETEIETAKATTAPINSESEEVVLRFAVNMMGQAQYESLIEAFEAGHENVHIKLVNIETELGLGNFTWEIPDDAYLQLASAADVIGLTATREAVAQGALLDLTTLIDSDPNIDAESFYPGLLESVQWDGGTWSLPVEATYSLINYNKKLFDAAGIDYPQPGWTWDELLNTAQALTIEESDSVAQWGLVQQNFDPVTWVQAMAGPLVNPETDPPTSLLTDPDTIEAVSWYTGLFLLHEVSPYYAAPEGNGPMRNMNSEAQTFINNEQAAMWLSGGMFAMGQMGRQEMTSNIAVVPFPVSNADDASTPAVVSGLSISKGTSKLDLAWEWCSFLAQQQARRMGRNFNAALGSNTVPALPSVAAASNYWDGMDKETKATLEYAIEHAFVDNYSGTGYETFQSAVVEVIENDRSVQDALEEAQELVETEINEEVAAAPTPVADLQVAEEEEAAVSAGAVTIQFGMNGMGRFGQTSFESLVDKFEEDNPDVLVEIRMIEGFRDNVGLAEMAAEYDCFQGSPNFSTESDLAAILSMEPFLSADPDLSKDDFYHALLEQFTHQGQVWGLPGTATVNLVTYNKDLFDAAGLDYPSLDWTQDDFLRAAVALTHGEDKNKQYGFVPNFSAIDDLVTLIDRWGADPFDDSGDPPRIVFNSPEVAEVMRWYTSLITQYKVTPIYETTNEMDFGAMMQQRQALIDQGKAAMWIEGANNRMFRRFGEVELNTGSVPLPAGPNSDQGSGFQSVNGFFISSQTENRQACWDWITFLTDQTSVSNGLAARVSVAESDAYRQEVGAETADAYLASISSGNRASFYQRISDQESWLREGIMWLNEAYEQIVNDQVPVEEALETTQEKIDAYRTCVIANDAFENREAIRACATEVE